MGFLLLKTNATGIFLCDDPNILSLCIFGYSTINDLESYMGKFQGKVVLVTGGISGIGRSIVLRLQQEGATVMTAQRRVDPHCDSIIADFSDPTTPARVIDELIEKTGKLDILINNAGMMQERAIEEMDLADWNKNIMVNLTAPFLLIQAALPFLKKSQGNIVNIGSTEGLASNPLHAAYCATKAGLHGLTRAVAVDHGSDGIRCNAVAPGWIDTDLNIDFINNMPDAKTFKKNLGRIHPIGRTGSPDEVAALVSFLASDDASFITGHIYTVDGGRMAKLSLP